MGKFLRKMLEQDAPVGGGTPAGDPELCFDPNTGAQMECPPAGETQAAAGGQDPALGGGPANQDTILVPEDADKGGDDEVKPDDNGACPEGYEKSDDGKCQKMGGTEGDGDKGEEKPDKEEARLPEGDKPPWMKDGDDDDDEKDGDDDEDGDDDDKDDDDDDDDKDKDDKKESFMYRSAVDNMVKGVLEGGKARDIVSQMFSKKTEGEKRPPFGR